MSASGDVWSSFSHDPRRPENAALRASDADREVVHQALADAYADGRLDRDELDSRTERAAAARTMAELPPLLEGLVPDSLVPALPSAPPRGDLMTPEQIEERALAKWQEERRSAVLGFVVASVVCWTIWAVTHPGFPWPVFVMLGTGINALKTATARESIVGRERRRLEKQQRKARGLPRSPDDEPDQ